MNTRQLQTDKNQKLYHALLGILLVCALAMMMLLSYWACKYSYYGAVDGRTRGVLVGDKTWAHIAVFLAASLCTMGIDKVLMKKDKSQQEKICLCTLIVTSVIAFILGVYYGVCCILQRWQFQHAEHWRVCGNVPAAEGIGTPL